MIKLLVLLIDDDKETLEQLEQLLPTTLCDCLLEWETCLGFNEALKRLDSRRYDVVVTDMAFKPPGKTQAEFRGLETVNDIRGKRFCPVIAYSTRSRPEGLTLDAFVSFADKSGDEKDLVSKLESLLKTGIPQIARRLHNELDGVGGEYLWQFLAKNWQHLAQSGCTTPEVLERLLRRRAATRIGRLNTDEKEVADVAGVEFYISPKITPGQLRLGEVLFEVATQTYRVVLTPHCLLTIQAGEQKPKAEFVLTVKTVPASALLANHFQGKQIPPEQAAKEKKVRSVIGDSPSVGNPAGRYWFLPGFLQMPDLYCDFLQMESLLFSEVDPGPGKKFEAVAVLDTPFAEALQSRFGEFYSSVGTPNLHPKYFLHLLPTNA
jgi:CheY-like chemotaxis protein